MIVAGCQLDIAWENKAANHARVLALLEEADLPLGSLVALPEMFSTGFSMNVAAITEGESRDSERFMADLARERGLFVLGGVVNSATNGRGWNESICFGPEGQEVARYAKIQPFSPGAESVHYTAGDRTVVFPYGEFTVAPFVCYDLRFPEVFRPAARAGATLFIVIASWPAVRIQHWVTLLQARAIENQAYVLGVNRTGRDPYHEYNGRSLIVDPHGNIVTDAGEGEGIVSAEIGLAQWQEYRSKLPFLADMRSDFVPVTRSGTA